ncbi:hypothetical protein COCMIDRAFT_8887 [Bipolaris oryzae ATCC 44560]|uniref:Uncharacterized protein n=1 Tax=Bipolaris oryzae ATCC 44560 TaxID=930090 RepID=W6Z149_COCMI|nr:uncharacterized protein COCMIDRAFT_8887 [Bipolaris oryzae ATCC 44560]EUC41389.1 hypothetical protein COCMIDRAFT_8887 [Bipolaris oryzae ATCC 44560]
MASPNFNPYQQPWQSRQYQQTPPSPAQPVYHYSQNHHPEYTQYAIAAASYVQPHYGSTEPAPVIAELPAPLPPAPPTTTSEEQLKQDELLARSMSQLEVTNSTPLMNPFPGSPQHLTPSLHQHRSVQMLRPHSRSVSYSNNQSPCGVAPRNSVSIPITHHRSAQSLRPHSKSVGTHAAPWSPASLNHAQKIDTTRFSTLPEVVVEPFPTGYSGPKLAEQTLPIPVYPDQRPVSHLPVALDHASLPSYVEKYRQAPYPPQWTPPPILQTLYAGRGGKHASGSCWLDTPASSTWSEERPSERGQDSVPPTFSFKFKSIGGSFRTPKLSWTMTCNEQLENLGKKASKQQATTWTYELKIDPKTNMRKSEVLTPSGPNSRDIMTTYVHALNYDSLRFIGTDRRAYMWVTSSRVSSIDGARYDTLRHALFVASGYNPDPLYGHIVADHCFWDGGVNNTAGNLPDEVIYIRSPEVDQALVVATLQVLKDWEKHTLKDEKKKKPEAFAAAEKEARKHTLGAASHWEA